MDSIAARFARWYLPKARGLRQPTATKLSHTTVIPEATYSPWLDDSQFMATFRTTRPNTLVDIYRAYELWNLVRETSRLNGDILEVGVWRGGTGCLMAARAKSVAPGARIFLCDTFQGVVKAGNHDSHYQGGEHSDTSVAIVEDLVKRLDLANVEIVQGVFPDESGERLQNRKFFLCHVDVDVYDSAKQITEWVWPRLAVGGVLVYDDYGFQTCDGVTHLVNERAYADRAISLQNLNGHALLVKLA